MRNEVYPGSGRGPYVQQVCARGAVLQGTVVLVEGGLQARRERVRMGEWSLRIDWGQIPISCVGADGRMVVSRPRG
jgi:hypothetical protein